MLFFPWFVLINGSLKASLSGSSFASYSLPLLTPGKDGISLLGRQMNILIFLLTYKSIYICMMYMTARDAMAGFQAWLGFCLGLTTANITYVA